MAKNRAPQKKEMDDFPMMMDSSFVNEEMMDCMMDHMIDANQGQMEVALELTRMIMGAARTPMNEESILATFKRSLKTINESCPIHQMMIKAQS